MRYNVMMKMMVQMKKMFLINELRSLLVIEIVKVNLVGEEILF